MTILCKNLICFILLITSTGISGQTLDIRIKNIKKTGGKICIAIFANESEFRTEKPCEEYKYDKKEKESDEFSVKIPIRSGQFGVSVLHDANCNGKMDYNIIGIPREGFGFSDFFHRGILKPHFDDFDFFVEKNEEKMITVVMKYF